MSANPDDKLTMAMDVRVKALEWQQFGPSVQVAKSAIGEYRITYHMAIEYHLHFDGKPVGDGPWRTDVPAKAAAQADLARRVASALEPSPSAERMREAGRHKLDNDRQVFFYEQDFYVLSNFSAFNLKWANLTFPTSEHAYHFEKFCFSGEMRTLRPIREEIRTAPSAHEAFKIAERNKAQRRPDWDRVKLTLMKRILRAKADQHEYVRRKLLATGDRDLIEDSWRDDFWGWGPNREGQNMLGKLWMEVRSDLRAALTNHSAQGDGK